MAMYIIRVQLTRESPNSYTVLRDKLLNAGFTKRIKNDEGIEYRLPNGNYLAISDRPIGEIFEVVKSIVSKIDRTPHILITEAKGNIWSGLQKC